MSYPMTRRCYQTLSEELTKLKKIRPEISERIDEARSHGDLKENAEYHAAREEQSLSEARIAQLEGKISSANIIDPETVSKNTVCFGVTVKIEDCDSGEEKIYEIVSEDEVSISNGRISINSPIARGMLTKKPGDTFTVSAPKGEMDYEVVDIT